MHIFAMAVWQRHPDNGVRRIRRSPPPTTMPGSATNSAPAAANFDGTGESYSEEALAVGTPTPLTRTVSDDQRDDLHLAEPGWRA